MTAIAILDKNHPAYQALLLGGACAVVSLALIGGFLLTNETIAEKTMEDQLSSLNQVLPQGSYDNNPLDTMTPHEHPLLLRPAELITATKDGDISATAMQVTVSGWGGPIDMLVATKPDGEVLGVRVISHKDTPGLADKIEIAKSNWITSFNGHSLSNTTEKQWAVQKDGGMFDQFTGATITPRAVVRGVHSALEVQQEWKQEWQQDWQQNQRGDSE